MNRPEGCTCWGVLGQDYDPRECPVHAKYVAVDKYILADQLEQARREGSVEFERAERILAENRALREALKFYAHPDNWREDDWGVRSVIQPPEYGKPGTIAREALEEK